MKPERPLPRPLARLAALFLLCFAASPAAAWWDYGHQTVARIAMASVAPDTRAAIRRLLRASDRLDTPTCPARTIEEASVWPDCIKRLGDRFSYAASWHYQNLDICRPFDPNAACRDGNCVSAQIERNFRLLKDDRLPTRERLMALIFLVHLVGDLHMPLHAGDRGDLGGNRFRAFYGRIRSNLHSIWDGYLAERAISTPPGGAAGLLAEVPAAERSAMAAGTVADWLRESWAAARSFAYGGVMTDPCGPLPPAPPVMHEATVRTLIPVVRRQVERGGLGLARLLDEALG